MLSDQFVHRFVQDKIIQALMEGPLTTRAILRETVNGPGLLVPASPATIRRVLKDLFQAGMVGFEPGTGTVGNPRVWRLVDPREWPWEGEEEPWEE